MGKVTRERYSDEFKSWVALEAIRGEQRLAELASKHGMHPDDDRPMETSGDQGDGGDVLRQASARGDGQSDPGGKAAREDRPAAGTKFFCAMPRFGWA